MRAKFDRERDMEGVAASRLLLRGNIVHALASRRVREGGRERQSACAREKEREKETLADGELNLTERHTLIQSV